MSAWTMRTVSRCRVFAKATSTASLRSTPMTSRAERCRENREPPDSAPAVEDDLVAKPLGLHRMNEIEKHLGGAEPRVLQNRVRLLPLIPERVNGVAHRGRQAAWHHARNAADNRIAAPAPGTSKSAR